MNVPTESETSYEYGQDFVSLSYRIWLYNTDDILPQVFAIIFLALCLFSIYRMVLYFDKDGGGKVITAFYGIIAFTTGIRSLWFMIPSAYLEGSYSPTPTIAFESTNWIGVLLSEILVALGSLSLYAIFILIACYWAHMLRKVDTQADSRGRIVGQPIYRRGPMETFIITISLIAGAQALSVLLFLLRVFNAEEMILFDAALLSLVSLATLIEITLFSHRIRMVLMTIGAINANNTKPQVRRIFAVTIAASFFFVTRVVVELGFAVSLIVLWRGTMHCNTSHLISPSLLVLVENHSFSVLIAHRYWDLYILIKHGAEVVVIVLDLIISTAIKTTPDRSNPAGGRLNATSNEQTPLLKSQGGGGLSAPMTLGSGSAVV